MIEKIIEYSARNRVIVLMIFGLIIAWGVWSVYKTPVDAIPDLSDNQVIVFTDYPGRSPQVVEDQVTYPLAVNLQGLPQVRAVRASSAFGFSMIYVIFEDKADIYWARTRVLERLNYAASLLPPGVVPTLGPDGTGVGHVFWYTIEGKGYDLEQLRTLQDWFVRYQLNTVQGVAEVASIGGLVREYQIDLDPNRLFAYKITVGKVMEAVKASNKDVGGRLIEQADAEYLIRGRGYVKSKADLENIVVGADMRGTPIYLKNLGTVQMGGAIRRGLLDMNGEGEAVGGIVVMRYGENAKDVIDRVKVKIKELEKGLPPGVKIKVSYDRSDLINRAIDTLKKSLLEESVVVSLVILVFLLHFQSALVIVLTLPISVLIAFITMKLMGVTSNIMSLGGIAIAIGVLVDAGVIMVENCYRHLSEMPPEERAARRLEVVIASRQTGRTGHLLLPGDHRALLRAGLHAGGAGRETVPPAGLHQDLLHDGLGPDRHHPGAGADVLLHAGQDAAGELQSGLDLLHQAVFAGHPLGAGLEEDHHRPQHRGPGHCRAVVHEAGQRVHAAPGRGVAALHAGHAPQRLHHRGQAPHPGAGHDHQERARGGACPGQGRPGRDLHRPGAGLHVREHHHPEAEGAVASGDQEGRHRGRAGRQAPADRGAQRLDPADHQPHQHALHRGAHRPGGQDLRH